MAVKAKINHISTKSDAFGGVSPAAELAIDALISGASISEAAIAAGVSRSTLSKWLHSNPLFQGVLNQRRAEVRAERMIGLSALIGDIESAIRNALADPEITPAVILQSGLSILPKLYTLLSEQPIGSTDPDKLARDLVRQDPLRDLDIMGHVDNDDLYDLLERSTAEMSA